MPLGNGHIKEDTQCGGFRFSSRLVVRLVGLSVSSRLTNQLLICGVVFSPLGCRWYLLDSAKLLEVSVCECECVCVSVCVCVLLFVWDEDNPVGGRVSPDSFSSCGLRTLSIYY